MNPMNALGSWLGLTGLSEPAVGIGLTDDAIAMVAVRPNPIRVTAIVRGAVPEAAVVGGEIRLPQLVTRELDAGRRRMHLPAGTAAGIAIEPAAAQFAVTIGGGGAGSEVEVAGGHFDRSISVVAGAGFRAARIDVVPVALARLAMMELPGEAVARNADGWQVSVSGDVIRAMVGDPLPGPELRLGPGRSRPAPIRRLERVEVAKQLDPVIDPGLDGVAIGAAMGALGLAPIVTPVPAATSASAAWMVQRVGAAL